MHLPDFDVILPCMNSHTNFFIFTLDLLWTISPEKSQEAQARIRRGQSVVEKGKCPFYIFILFIQIYTCLELGQCVT